MNKFFKHLFNQTISYIVKTRIGGLNQVLWTLCHDENIEYERLHHLETDEEHSNGWFVIEITATPKDIKKLIKTLKQRLDWADLILTEIYEENGTVNILEKSRRAK